MFIWENVNINADYVFDDGIDGTGRSTGTYQHDSSRGAMNQMRDMIADDMWERYQSSPCINPRERKQLFSNCARVGM